MNVLVVYHYDLYPCRTAILDHLYSFQRHLKANVYYFNTLTREVPDSLRKMNWDLVIFHTIFLIQRCNPPYFQQVLDKVAWLRDLDTCKVVLPQDENQYAGILNDFINDFDIRLVFSVAPSSEWPRLYPQVDASKVSFHEVLCGYLDDATLQRIERLANREKSRPCDVFYRAAHSPFWLGRGGILKWQIARVFQQAGAGANLRLDISTRDEDVLTGDQWFVRLLQSKYVLGVEAGGTILDYDGSIRKKTEAYVAEHPEAEFEEVEGECFPGQDDSVRYLAVSPRILEAAATKTCQVLVEGRYSGLLQAGVHYIPVKPDFSNVGEVVERLSDEENRQRTAERTYADLVASRGYSYQGFVQTVIGSSLQLPTQAGAKCVIGLARNRLSDMVSWMQVRFHAWLVGQYYAKAPVMKQETTWKVICYVRKAWGIPFP